MSAPATHSQPSRKGKKAWRKNVDLDELHQGLEQVRDQEILTGGKTLHELESDALFQADTAGSVAVRRQTRKDHGTLKSNEILAQRSAIPAVSLRKRKGDAEEDARKKQKKIPYRELQRLKALATGSATTQQGLDNIDSVPTDKDPWADEVEQPVNPNFTFIDKKKPKVQPSTMARTPVSMIESHKSIPNVRKPTAGKSYNPAFQDWQHVIAREGDKELEREKKRLADAVKEQDRLDRIAKSAEHADREADKADLSEYESEWEGILSDYEESFLTKKRPERKTPAERNKVKRRRQAEAQARHEARMLQREKQAKQIAAIKRSIDEKEKAKKALQKFPGSVESSDADEDDEEALKKHNPFGKRSIPNAPLEVVLADELEDSLRRLKPEGNLLMDRYRTAVMQGKTEPRKAAPMQKKRNVKPTEKWSYKDWKLDRKTK